MSGPGEAEGANDAGFAQLVLREMRQQSRLLNEVRTVLMVSTPDRGCVLDDLRKHSAQIDELGQWADRHEQTHMRAPSAPSGIEKMFASMIDGAAKAIGAGIVALIGWGVVYVITKGSP